VKKWIHASPAGSVGRYTSLHRQLETTVQLAIIGATKTLEPNLYINIKNCAIERGNSKNRYQSKQAQHSIVAYQLTCTRFSSIDYMHIQTRTHTHARTHTHTHTHARAHTHTHTHTNTHTTHTHPQTHAPTHKHTRAHKHKRVTFRTHESTNFIN
jgi:hypothetical protein